MLRRALLVLFLVCPLVVSAADEPADPVAAKVDKAIDTYKSEMKTYREKATAWLDSREGTARKAGNKKAVDAIHEEQRVFRVLSDLPKYAPEELRQRPVDAKTKLIRAYEAAAKGWTKAGNVKAAADAEKMLKVVKDWLDISLTRRVFEDSASEFRMVGRGKWLQKVKGGADWPFTEIDRTKEYVEIQVNYPDGVRDTIRIYETRADFRRGPDTAPFAAGGVGKWLE